MYEHVTQEEWAYLAGIIDSEGTIGCARIRESQYNTYISITNTNHNVIVWIQQKFGGNIGTFQPKGKKAYRWSTRKAELQRVIIEHILQYLIVKYEQAELLLAFPHERVYADADIIAEREEIYEWMRILNKKGA